MQQQNTRSPAVILGVIGGILLVAGSFMTWATVTLNLDTFAKVISDATGQEVHTSDLAALGLQTSDSAKGTSSDGRWTLVAGIVVLVCAILLVTKESARAAATRLMVTGGIAGLYFTIVNLATKNSQIDDAIAKIQPQLAQAGISNEAFKTIFSLTWGLGIYVCLVGGAIALAGGIVGRRAPVPSPTFVSSGPDPVPDPLMGFQSSSSTAGASAQAPPAPSGLPPSSGLPSSGDLPPAPEPGAATPP